MAEKKAPILTDEEIDGVYFECGELNRPSLSYLNELLVQNQRDADHDFYTLPKEETIKRIATREWAKKHLCGGCTGTRQSGSYFSNDCKGEALKCRRIDLFIRGATQLYNKLFKEGGGK